MKVSWHQESARRSTGAVLGIVLGTFVLGAPPAQDPWYGWRVLEMRARSTLLRGEVELRIEDTGDERRLETSTSARFLGATIARSRTVTTLDRATGRTREFVSYSRKRVRRYRFGDRSYVVERLVPPAKGSTDEREWEVRSRAEFAYPTATDGRTQLAVFDYYGMLLHLRQAPLDHPGDEVTLHVATPDGPRAYRVIVAERLSTERVYTDLASSEKVRRMTTESRLRIIPADPTQADLGFLEMEGETELWVEAGSKTLLELSGRVPRVPGRVKLLLSALR